MRGLTLIRPMPAAIVHGSKRIENRPNNLPKAMRGVPTIVAVHAGKKWDIGYMKSVYKIDGKRSDGDVGDVSVLALPIAYANGMQQEGIVGLMRLTGRVFATLDDVVDTRGLPMGEDPRWFSGPFGYEIDRVVAFETPVACRGMQGFWPVPENVLAQMKLCGACGWHHRRDQPITGCVLR